MQKAATPLPPWLLDLTSKSGLSNPWVNPDFCHWYNSPTPSADDKSRVPSKPPVVCAALGGWHSVSSYELEVSQGKGAIKWSGATDLPGPRVSWTGSSLIVVGWGETSQVTPLKVLVELPTMHNFCIFFYILLKEETTSQRPSTSVRGVLSEDLIYDII